MNKDLSHIEFYFPEGNFSDKEDVAKESVGLIVEKKSIDYSGYMSQDLLKEGLISHMGSGEVNSYRGISSKQKQKIGQVIQETIDKCNRHITVPTKNYIFVHPYFPNEEEKVFNGVMAVAVYSAVFHVFIDLSSYTDDALENIIAHELNHTIFYFHHYDNFNNYTLLDNILMEGLAENFREEFFNKNRTSWAGALEKKEALEIAVNSKDIFHSKNEMLIKEFLFGSDTYKKWTGYSVGYWMVKEYIEKNPDTSWDNLIKADSNIFLTIL